MFKTAKIKYGHFKKEILLLLGSLIILFVLSVISGQMVNKRAVAGSQHNLSGYAWSDNIGWISFNCTNNNSCGSSDYGVNVSQNGDFSGYAWSDNIGWVTFNENELSGCPSGQCRAKMSGNGAVTGWAKALAGGTTQSGGWDGWISLSGASPNYGVVFSQERASGFSWGSDVVGWIDWSGGGSPPPSGCPDPNGCGVRIGDLPEYQSPVASITSPQNNTTISIDEIINFNGTAYITSGYDATNYEWRDYGNNTPPAGECSSGVLLNNNTSYSGSYSYQAPAGSMSLGDHRVYFRVKDNISQSETWSNNCPSVTINVSSGVTEGVCGSAGSENPPYPETAVKPTENLCDYSTLPPVVSGTNPWSWTCYGSNQNNSNDDALCQTANSCGNGLCEKTKGETPSVCPNDCKIIFEEI